MDIEALIKGFSRDQDEEFSSRAQACKALRDFINKSPSEINVGDFVERNEFGLKRYRMPGPNQAAICVKKLEYFIDREGSYNDLLIVFATGKDSFVTHAVDSRYYKIAAEAPANVFSFRKKK